MPSRIKWMVCRCTVKIEYHCSSAAPQHSLLYADASSRDNIKQLHESTQDAIRFTHENNTAHITQTRIVLQLLSYHGGV